MVMERDTHVYSLTIINLTMVEAPQRPNLYVDAQRRAPKQLSIKVTLWRESAAMSLAAG